MNKSIQQILYILFSVFLLNACDGDVLFRTKPCEEGTVRQGGACLSETGIVEPASETTNTIKTVASANCKDPDLNKLQKGETVTMCDGSVGEGKLVECSKDGEQDCIAKSKFKVVNIDNLSSGDIKNGKVVAGLTGSLRAHKQCRNYSALATFDSSYLPSNFGWNVITFAPATVTVASNQIAFTDPHGLITNSPVRFTSTTTLPAPLVAGTIYYAIYVSDTVIRVASVANGVQIDITSQGTGLHTAHDVADSTPQYFDTVDDNNNDQTFSPANNPWSSNDYLCDAANFVNVTSSSAPLLPSGMTPPTGTQPFTQIWQDQISGTYISNILSVGGGRSWSDAIRACESLNGGNAGDGWRLPTQKELIQLYIHGISKVALAGGSTNVYFWSSSVVAGSTGNAWIVDLSYGYITNSIRYNTSRAALCIR